MYNQHFGLDRSPFKITPDTSQFFSGGERGSVLEAIMYAIASGEGIIKVIGEVGTGKTMLCRMLQLRLPDDVELIYISNPNVSAENILNVMAIELKIINEPVNKIAAQNHLHEYLLNAYRANKRVVVFVEEAQGMPLETLEEIRMLTNLETDTDKLMQIVLFGQPELDKNLMQPSIRQLKERIAHNFYLQPLKIKDIKEYLNFRTRNTGYHGPDLFNEKVSKAIGRYSKGLIRRINILADKAMLAAYADGTNTIESRHVKKAVNDSDFNANLYWQHSHTKLVSGIAALVVLIALGLVFFDAFRSQIDDPLTANIPIEFRLPNEVRAQTITPPVISTELLVDTEAEVDQVENDVTLDAPANTPEIAVTEPEDARIDAYYLDESIKKEYGLLGELGYQRLAERLLETHDWLKNAEDGEYTIQIMLLRNRSIRSLERFLRQLENKISIKDVFVYETSINNSLMYGVLYQQFADRQAADQGVEDLPAVFDSSRPVMLRTVKGIREEVATSKI